MSYKLVFKEEAKKEWEKLNETIRAQLKKQLKNRLINPHVPSARLRGLVNFYKIKLRSAGYRLVYEVRDKELIVSVIAIGKRDRNSAYKNIIKRIQ